VTIDVIHDELWMIKVRSMMMMDDRGEVMMMDDRGEVMMMDNRGEVMMHSHLHRIDCTCPRLRPC
jgi:hypothetical protein